MLDLAVWDDRTGAVLWAASSPVMLRPRGASVAAAVTAAGWGGGGGGGGGSGGFDETRYVLVFEDDHRGWLWMELLADATGAGSATAATTTTTTTENAPPVFFVQAAALSLLLERE